MMHNDKHCRAGDLLKYACILFVAYGISPAVPQVKNIANSSLAPYVPSPMVTVEKMLEMAQVTKKDIVYDLGCGDGRIVITAAKKYGARGVGIELSDAQYQEAVENVKAAKVQHLVTILHQDIMDVDLSPATVVTTYLLPGAMQKLRPIFEAHLKPGTRVVSHDYDIPGWVPDASDGSDMDHEYEHMIYLYVIKDNKGGSPAR